MPELLILSPKEINDTLVGIGKKKAALNSFELFMFAILAGIYIALGATAAAVVLSGGTADTGIAKFAAGVVFSTGLILVLLAGAELFTGNMLMTAGLIERKYFLVHILRNWTIVWVGNFVGSLFVVGLVYGSGYLFAGDGLSKLGETLVKIGDAKMALLFWPAFYRGILCNILVCLAIVISLSSVSTEGKILAIVFPITAFIISSYEHSVANMFFIPVALAAKGELLTRIPAMMHNLLPVTLGNIAGGVLVVLLHPKSFKRLKNFLAAGKTVNPNP
jgi:formate/nitrite transporter